jgi:hypothetical protein
MKNALKNRQFLEIIFLHFFLSRETEEKAQLRKLLFSHCFATLKFKFKL